MKRHVHIIENLQKPSFSKIDGERVRRLNRIQKEYGSKYSLDSLIEIMIAWSLAEAKTDNINTDMELYQL